MGYWMERAKQLREPDDPTRLSAEEERPHSIDPEQAEASPMPPLQPGWLVAYRNQGGTLCGGCDDRAHGTVHVCRWDGNGWTVELTDGQRLTLSAIRSVGKTDRAGQIVGAWTVREHGYDGEGPGQGPLHNRK